MFKLQVETGREYNTSEEFRGCLFEFLRKFLVSDVLCTVAKLFEEFVESLDASDDAAFVHVCNLTYIKEVAAIIPFSNNFKQRGVELIMYIILLDIIYTSIGIDCNNMLERVLYLLISILEFVISNFNLISLVLPLLVDKETENDVDLPWF